MDSLNSQYRDVVEKVLKDYADFLGNDERVPVELVFDRERDRTPHTNKRDRIPCSPSCLTLLQPPLETGMN